MPQIGPLEILAVAVIALVVFGPDKLPGFARDIGKFLSQIKKTAEDLKGEFSDGMSDFKFDENENEDDAGEEVEDEDFYRLGEEAPHDSIDPSEDDYQPGSSSERAGTAGDEEEQHSLLRDDAARQEPNTQTPTTQTPTTQTPPRNFEADRSSEDSEDSDGPPREAPSGRVAEPAPQEPSDSTEMPDTTVSPSPKGGGRAGG